MKRYEKSNIPDIPDIPDELWICIFNFSFYRKLSMVSKKFNKLNEQSWNEKIYEPLMQKLQMLDCRNVDRLNEEIKKYENIIRMDYFHHPLDLDPIYNHRIFWDPTNYSQIYSFWKEQPSYVLKCIVEACLQNYPCGLLAIKDIYPDYIIIPNAYDGYKCHYKNIFCDAERLYEYYIIFLQSSLKMIDITVPDEVLFSNNGNQRIFINASHVYREPICIPEKKLCIPEKNSNNKDTIQLIILVLKETIQAIIPILGLMIIMILWFTILCMLDRIFG